MEGISVRKGLEAWTDREERFEKLFQKATRCGKMKFDVIFEETELSEDVFEKSTRRC